MRFRALSACALAACVSLLAAPAAAAGQDTAGQAKHAQVSDAERKAAEKINQAADPAAKLSAADEFLKKYPKSSLRPRIAESLAGGISGVQDPAQRITAAERYLSIFKEPGEADQLNATLLDAYLSSGRAEDSFRMGGTWLEKNPDDIDVLRRLAITSSNEAIKGNNKFVEQGHKYGARAIELVEADKKPAGFDDAQWAEYKTKWMPGLYREAGILALRTGNKAGAKASLEKAVAHKSTDPAVYMILSELHNEEYVAMVPKYQAMPAGAEKQAMLTKVQAQLDKVIEFYAQSVALTDGNAQFKEANVQIRQDLENYYKFRHNGSTEGLQKMIDKYKPAPTP